MELEFVAQNWHLFLALVAIIALLVFDASKGTMTGIKKVAVLELPQLINHDDAIVVDVCEPNEYKKGHIPGAVNVPLSGLKDNLNSLDKYKKRKVPLVVSCQSGNRSAKAASILRKHEFETVYNLTGGFAAWQKENFPIEK